MYSRYITGVGEVHTLISQANPPRLASHTPFCKFFPDRKKRKRISSDCHFAKPLDEHRIYSSFFLANIGVASPLFGCG